MEADDGVCGVEEPSLVVAVLERAPERRFHIEIKRLMAGCSTSESTSAEA